MSLDLDKIRKHSVLTRDGFYHVVGNHYCLREADFDALLAEVERLRRERDHYRRAMEFADAEAVRLRAQVADYRVMIDGLETAAHEERAAVVAWLRRKATDDFCALRVKEACDAEKSADDIERGEHRREEEP